MGQKNLSTFVAPIFGVVFAVATPISAVYAIRRNRRTATAVRSVTVNPQDASEIERQRFLSLVDGDTLFLRDYFRKLLLKRDFQGARNVVGFTLSRSRLDWRQHQVALEQVTECEAFAVNWFLYIFIGGTRWWNRVGYFGPSVSDLLDE